METELITNEEGLRPNNDFGPFSLIMIFSIIDAVLVGCGFMWIHDTYLPTWWIIGGFVGASWAIAGLCAIGLIAGSIVHIIQYFTLKRIRRKGLKSLKGHTIQQPISKQN